MIKVPTRKLANGVEIPVVGLGTMNEKTQEEMDVAVKAAIEAGYTLFDSAYCYGQEKELGIALRNAGVKREDVMITTKSRMLRHSFDDCIDTVYSQLKTFGTNYFDLYLLHWPLPCKPALYVEAWKALEKLYKDGVIRAIGVSNFFVEHLEKLRAEGCEIMPMVDQVQSQPYYINHELREYCKKNNIVMESWQPFGGGVVLNDPVIGEVAKKYGKSPAQIIVKWQVANDFLPIPGPIEPDWIKENLDVFDFEFEKEDLDKLNALECQKPILIPVCNGVYDPNEFPIMW